jgi:hypothetical protein
MSNIDVLFPVEKTIKIQDKDFTIREFHVREFPQVVKFAAKIGINGQDNIMEAVEGNIQDVLNIVASITNQPLDVIESMRLPVLLHLIEKIIEENIDFFVVQLPVSLNRVSKMMTGGLTQPNS